MSTNNLKLSASVALTLAGVLLAPSQAVGAEYWLKTGTTSFSAPDGANVPMWGYAMCTDGSGSSCTAVTVPGPALTVPAGDASGLIVHLINTLPQPTSLVINGLIKPMVPVWNDGKTGARTSATQRVRSFDVEAAANTGTADYIWTNVKPGTYLYQSGTQPQVQVQMGLFGAVTSNTLESTATAPAQAYAGVTYDNQATLLFSEIDPVLHAAINDGSYGTTGPTSTFGYAPKYFLINGKPYVGTADSVISPAGGTGNTLLRLLNAGLTTHVPMIQGTHWTLIAEDGKKSPVNGKQYTALLPAAKTVDVLLTADSGGAIYPIMDRRLSLSNNGTSNGGMLAYLRFGATGGTQASGDANTIPVAGDDAYESIKGVTLTLGGRGVLVNDTDLDGLPQPLKAVAATGPTLNGGTYTLNANGSFTYVPKVGFSGADSFTYSATDGKALSNAATVTITVTDPGAPALALLDDFTRSAASVNLGSPNWNQVSGGTPAEPNIQANGTEAFAKATNLGGLAIWNTLLPAAQGASFKASSLAGSGLVLKATGGTTSSPANYVRVRCETSGGGEVVVATMMGGSNVSIFVRQGGFAAPGCLGSGTLSAVVDAKGIVTTFLGNAFVGGVQLPDVAAWKGTGRIGIQLQTVNAAINDFSGGAP
jgi:Bacterial Ig domain/Multicopper oxidase